jgi:hypothetical protein
MAFLNADQADRAEKTGSKFSIRPPETVPYLILSGVFRLIRFIRVQMTHVNPEPIHVLSYPAVSA